MSPISKVSAGYRVNWAKVDEIVAEPQSNLVYINARIASNSEIGDDCILLFCKLEDNIEVGNRVYVSNYTIIGKNNSFSNAGKFGDSLKVGDNSKFSNHSMFGSRSIFDDNIEFDNSVVIGNECNFGNRIQIGNNAVIGSYSSFGNGAKFGDYVEIGNWVRFGRRAQFGDGVKFGKRSSFDIGAIFGDSVIFGYDRTLLEKRLDYEAREDHRPIFSRKSTFGKNCKVMRWDSTSRRYISIDINEFLKNDRHK